MRNDDNRGLNPLQPGLEPDHGVKVEVVRRFVEKEQIRRTHQGAGEREAVSPAAREITDRKRGLRFRESETVKNGFGIRGDRAFIQFRKCRHGLSERHIIARPFSGLQSRLGSFKRGVAGEHEIECRHINRLDVLGNVRDAVFRRVFDFPCFCLNFSENRGENRRFSAAVRTDETDTFAVGREHRGVAVENADASHKADINKA